METRHLIEVKIDGELKIAQYGQWDGFIEGGQGENIARFIHEEMNKEKFCAALRGCRFLTPEDLEVLGAELDGTDWKKTHPHLSRDAGADILSLVQDGKAKNLKDSREFKEDTLFCEYHYLIDMDTETVTVNGFGPVPFAEWTPENNESLNERYTEWKEANAGA